MRTEIERRAAVHAALGEPLRLAIVDELSSSDRAPSDLAARFGLAAAAKRAGLDLAGAQPRALDAGDLDADVVVTVCDRAHEEVDPPDDWLHWSIPDPVDAGTRRAFDAALGELDERIAALAGPIADPKEPRS
jgi:DNA-binding transcriptional ArsR family regulator